MSLLLPELERELRSAVVREHAAERRRAPRMRLLARALPVTVAVVVATVVVVVALGVRGRAPSAGGRTSPSATGSSAGLVPPNGLAPGQYWYVRRLLGLHYETEGLFGRRVTWRQLVVVETWTGRTRVRQLLVPAGPVRFRTPADRRRWREAHSVPLGMSKTLVSKPGGPFVLAGGGHARLSYAQLRSLPDSEPGIRVELERLWRPPALPPRLDRAKLIPVIRASWLVVALIELAHLPTTPAVHAVVLRAIEHLPGVKVVSGVDPLGRHGTIILATRVGQDLAFDPKTGGLLSEGASPFVAWGVVDSIGALPRGVKPVK